MAWWDSIIDPLKGLYRELTGGGVTPKDKSLADIPKQGFTGSTKGPDIRQAVRAQSPFAKAMPVPPSAAPAPSAAPVERPEAFTPDRLEQFTDMPIEQLETRMTATHYAFQSTYGFEPPESTVLAIATNPGIKDGAIGSLFSRNPGVLAAVQALGKGISRAVPSLGRGVREAGKEVAAQPGYEDISKVARFGLELVPGGANYNNREEVVALYAEATGGRELSFADSINPNLTNLDMTGEELASLSPEKQQRWDDLINENFIGALPAGALGAAGIKKVAGKVAGKGVKGAVEKIVGKYGGDKQVIRRVSERMEERAQMLGFGSLGDMPTHTIIPMAEQAGRAIKLMKDNPKLAEAVALGKATAPEGLLPNQVHIAMEAKALSAGDHDMLVKLANSPITEDLSIAGATIRSERERLSTSPVKVIREVQEARAKGAARKAWRTPEVEAGHVAKEIQQEFAVAKETVDKVAVLKRMQAALGKKRKSPTFEEKVVKLVKLGGLDSDDYLDLARAKIGAEVTGEEVRALAKLTRTMDDAKTAIDAGGDPTEYARARVIWMNYIKTLKNPTDKLGAVEHLRNISPAQILKPANWGQILKDAAGVGKVVGASMDISALLRQGWKTLFTHNRQWRKNAVKNMLDIPKALRGGSLIDETAVDTFARENYLNGYYRKSRLAVGVTEEDYPTALPEKIPGLGRLFKASGELYTSFLQRQRKDIFDYELDVVRTLGLEINDEMLDGLGRMANKLTGRGSLGKAEGFAEYINLGIFSPRNTKSHFEMLTQVTTQTNAHLKWRSATQLLKVVSGTAAVLAVADVMRSGSDEWDSTSANFGKIRIGSTRFDVAGGMGSLLVLGARLALKKKTSSTSGKVIEIDSEEWGSPESFEMVYDFFENKLSPAGAFVKTVITGKDFIGKPKTKGEAVKTFLTPIIAETPGDLGTTIDSVSTASALILEGLGVSVQTYIAPDNPFFKLDQAYQEDYVNMSTSEKFQSRYGWRKQIRSEFVRMANQERNRPAGVGWSGFLELWDARNSALQEADISPNSSKFNKELWERKLQELFDENPQFEKQYEQIPDKLMLR